jgi:hypothetical protein
LKIDLLYFDGCPSWQQALANLETVIHEENLDVTVNRIDVRSDQEAVQYRFLGSPSFKVDGVDLWPESRDEFSMNCRVYKTSHGLMGWPTIEMLRDKLKELNGPPLTTSTQ